MTGPGQSNGDPTTWSRYEFKYLVTEAQAATIAGYVHPYVRPDPYSEHGPYPLVSLYLDSHDLRLWRESLEGVKNRFKLRIRSYSDDPEAPRFFEIKRRIDQIVVKSRARVSDRDVVPLLTGGHCLCWNACGDRRNLEQFLYYLRSVNAKPIVRVRYDRQALVGVWDDRVRITFDRHLSLNMTDEPSVRLNDVGWRHLPQREVVLEIKFTGRCPVWLTRMAQCAGLRRQSVSKYAIAVKEACGLRFCAPVVAREDFHGRSLVCH
ncbi:MAG: polyphosphate polymerase domain-containing protein [Phycisphaerae bacterium]|nr:polyphosphate polymerase domain-containing protein [Phycisphaerae bacterium]